MNVKYADTLVAEKRGAVLNMPSGTVTQCLKNYMVQQSVCDPNYGGALMYVLFGESLSNFVKHSANHSQSHWREPDIARGARLTERPPLSVIIRKHSRRHQPQSICLSII